MNKVLAVVKRQLLETAKNPRAFALTLAMPIILVVLIGNIFTFGPSSGDPISISIPVVFQDSSTSVDQSPFLTALTKIPGLQVTLEPMSMADAQNHVSKKTDRSGYIVVPAGFNQAMASRQATNLQVFTTSDTSGRIIQSLLQNAASNYNTTVLMVVAAGQQAGQSGQKFDANAAAQSAIQLQQRTDLPTIKINMQNVVGASYNQFDQVAPGYATMFVIFGLNTVVLAILGERTRGTMRRLAVMPLPKWAFMAGKMIAQFIISFIQVSLMLAVAKFGFGANITTDNILGVTLLVIALSFAATALGMLIVSLFSNEAAANPVVTLVALIGSALGGAWVPLFLMPDWVQQVSKVTINSWAMSGFNGLMIFGQTLGEVLPDILVLIAYGLVCLAIATRFFRYSEV
jgi:ABC-2 type transport system permease protein